MPAPAASPVVILLRYPTSSTNMQRISSSLMHHIFPPFLVPSLLSNIKLVFHGYNQVYSASVCEEEKIPCCHFSICYLCHVLLLPIDLFFFHCCCYFNPSICRVLLVSRCLVFSVAALVLLTGKCLSSAALTMLAPRMMDF